MHTCIDITGKKNIGKNDTVMDPNHYHIVPGVYQVTKGQEVYIVTIDENKEIDYVMIEKKKIARR